MYQIRWSLQKHPLSFSNLKKSFGKCASRSRSYYVGSRVQELRVGMHYQNSICSAISGFCAISVEINVLPVQRVSLGSSVCLGPSLMIARLSIP